MELQNFAVIVQLNGSLILFIYVTSHKMHECIIVLNIVKLLNKIFVK